jgi:hypothetical protein
MSKIESNKSDPEIIKEYPLPTGDLPDFSKITSEEFRELLNGFTFFTEEEREALLDKFVEEKKKLES